MLKIDNLRGEDVEYIEDLVISSARYLKGEIPDRKIIDVGNYICDISWTYWKYEDQKLSAFKGTWSEVTDIEEEIRTGKANFCTSYEARTQEYLDQIIDEDRPKMKKWCQEIIEEYSPILKALKKKYPKDYKESDMFYIEELINVTKGFLNVKIDSYTIISEIDWLYSELKEYSDQKLLIFAGMWSEIVDIKSNIEKGNKSKEDLQQYLDSKSNIISEMCKIIIEEYTPILEELRKKFM
jgi:hypothetical protein